jgi:hypothetical protein
MAAFMESFRIWIDGTAASAFMAESWWAWRAAESLHFIGLSLLIGTVGMFDLRMMGLVKRVPLSALHRMVPWGVFGYLINVSTGILFFAGFPDQYMYNPSFQIKMMFMAMAGINVLVFYLVVYGKIKALGPEDDAPRAARIIGLVSLLCWMGVITCGRLLTFYRPPWYWCPWC